MNLLEAIFGKRCDHDFHITNTIKDKFYSDKDGIFAEETEVHTCSKCGKYYFLNRGYKKQEPPK
jgi:hypothetical protein